MKFTAIIPAYNEEKTLEKVLLVFTKIPEINQIIVVNDGSTDKTENIALKFKNKIDLISYPQNKGKGYALWCGFKKAKNEAIVTWDADFTNLQKHHVQRLLKPLKEKRADLVVGIVAAKLKKSFKTPKALIKFWRWWEKNYVYTASGQRAGYKKDFLKIPYLKDSRYAVDLLITDWFLYKGKIIKKVFLKNTGHLLKEKKWGKQGLKLEFKTFKEIFESFKHLKAKQKLALEGIRIPLS